MRRFLCISAVAVAAALTLVGGGAHATQEPDSTILRAIHVYRAKTWRFEQVMGRPLTRVHASTLVARRDAWRAHAAHARRRFVAGPPHRRAWLCIHRYEGSWKDRGAPYYGGLQMDISFQRHYAPRVLRTKGTADRWLPLEQMWVAERAYRSGRGFYPWPNTARYCGLI